MNSFSDVALLVIDVQQGFDDPRFGVRNNPDAERKIAALLEHWRTAKRPLVHVRHSSTEPDSPLRPERPGFAFKPECVPVEGEQIFHKQVNSAFIGTSLQEYLRKNQIDSVVIVGFTTDHCISTTTRMAANLGFKTFLVSDATATFERTGPDGRHYTAEEIHSVSIASLSGEFATIVSTAELISPS